MQARPDPRRPRWTTVLAPDDALEVFRFVHHEDLDPLVLEDDFLSDAAKGKTPRGRSVKFPELMQGMSAFRSLDLARERWADLALLAQRRGEEPRVGSFVAKVVLAPGEGFDYDDLGRPDGHLTIRGDAVKLAGAVVEIVPASV